MPEIQITFDDMLKKIGTLTLQIDVLQAVNQGLAKENEALKEAKKDDAG